MKQRFNSFAELARHKKEGVDYKITVDKVPGSKIAIVAPHAGYIEWFTSEIARGIAANDHNLYAFEGLQRGDYFYELHVTSTAFTEPRCLNLIAESKTTVAIHGCRGMEPVVYLGGRDRKLRGKLAASFNAAGIKAKVTGHPYTGKNKANICNRNKRKKGVQLEFSQGIRDNPALRAKCVQIIRQSLEAL